jgi:hypothetical protein
VVTRAIVFVLLAALFTALHVFIVAGGAL